MMGYPSDATARGGSLHRLPLALAYDEVMALDHRERQRWVAEVAKINRRLNDGES